MISVLCKHLPMLLDTMKPTEMPMVSLAIIWMLAFYTVPSASVPIIPGWVRCYVWWTNITLVTQF